MTICQHIYVLWVCARSQSGRSCPAWHLDLNKKNMWGWWLRLVWVSERMSLNFLLNKHFPPARRWEVICLPTSTPSPSDLWGFRHLHSNLEWDLDKLSLDLTVSDSSQLWVWESKNRPTAMGWCHPDLDPVNKLTHGQRMCLVCGMEWASWQRMPGASDSGPLCAKAQPDHILCMMGRQDEGKPCLYIRNN